MAIEMGGKTGLIKTDKVTENYLKSRGYPYKEIVPKDPNYEKYSNLMLMISRPKLPFHLKWIMFTQLKNMQEQMLMKSS